MVDDLVEPRALSEATVALDRLDWIGKPVVLVGDTLSGRRLPADADERISWVREALHRPDLDVVLFDEPDVERPGAPVDRGGVERWRTISEAWNAGRLLTRRSTSVGSARRAGLEVFRVGPRGTTITGAIERPDHEPRDLMDAVGRLLVVDTFSGQDRTQLPDSPDAGISGVLSASATADPSPVRAPAK